MRTLLSCITTRFGKVLKRRVVVTEGAERISLAIPTTQCEGDQLEGVQGANSAAVKLDVTTLGQAINLLTGGAEQACWPG